MVKGSSPLSHGEKERQTLLILTYEPRRPDHHNDNVDKFAARLSPSQQGDTDGDD